MSSSLDVVHDDSPDMGKDINAGQEAHGQVVAAAVHDVQKLHEAWRRHCELWQIPPWKM